MRQRMPDDGRHNRVSLGRGATERGARRRWWRRRSHLRAIVEVVGNELISHFSAARLALCTSAPLLRERSAAILVYCKVTLPSTQLSSPTPPPATSSTLGRAKVSSRGTHSQISRLPSLTTALWKDGLDYRHGTGESRSSALDVALLTRSPTGHGVGSFLNVHEGPHGIGTRITYNDVKLQPGHVVSNEPGCYLDGEFGIRIENVVVVQPADTPNNFGGTKFLKMERFTMVSKPWLGVLSPRPSLTLPRPFLRHVAQVPISTNLVEVSLLSPDELEWLNDYNAEVRSKLSPLLSSDEDADALAWLEKETKPLTR